MAVWPLVGRDEELALLQRLLLDDGRGAVVVAPAGTGKTRLVQEAIRRVGETAATEHVAGTRSARTLPLAAVAALLPDDASTVTDQVELFRVVRRTMAERAGSRPIVLAVDDAQLLDPISAALVHHLAMTEEVRLLVAIRAGEPVEDAITALWRDGLAERIDLQPLGLDDVSALLQAVLGGEIESATAWRLWSVAGGNPLYAHELVNEAMRVGALSIVDGVWRWRGEVQVGARLRELVELRLSVLADDEREVVALLAVGDLMTEELVESACAPSAVTALQGRGFVERMRNGTTTELKLDHPLFAEVVRHAMSATATRRRWCRFLAEAVDPEDGDLAVMRRAVWQIGGGIATDPDFLTHAAERANHRWDGVLGERLAHAALDAGGGSTARVVRAEACFQIGRFKDALTHAQPLEDADLSDELLARLGYVLAEAGYWGLGRVEETVAALRRIEGRVNSVGAGQRIRALLSAIALASGRLQESYAMALPIASDPDADDQARMRAVTAAANGLSMTGRPDAALELCESLLPVAFALLDDYPRGLGWVVAQSLTALACLGRHAEAEAVLTPVRDTAIADGDDEAISGSSIVLGRLALTRGDLATAGVMLREGLTVLRAYDTAGYVPWCLGMMAQVAAQQGDATTARAVLVELEHDDWVVRLNDHEVEIGRAWAAAAAGEIVTPVRIVLDAAELKRADGNVVLEGVLLHEALRLGIAPRDVIERLEGICSGRNLPLHEVLLAHAVALAADDGAALDAVADSFEGLEMLLLAAEAAAEAARAPARRATRSRHALGRERESLAGEVSGRAHPALSHIVESPELTRREREVCHLAARGLSNSTIADQLSVSIRTVEGHLLRGSTKLGVRNRGELEQALGRAENA